MKDRLRQIIQYKTNGRQRPFAAMMGWLPQYLHNLLIGETFGLKAVVTILEKLPEIDARWLILGQGEMIDKGAVADMRNQLYDVVDDIMAIERFIPIMEASEIEQLRDSLAQRKRMDIDLDTLSRWENKLSEREIEIRRKVIRAQRKSEELCKQKKAKK